MSRDDDLRQRILSGRSDANIRFEQLRSFLLRLGFTSAFAEATISSGEKVSAN